MVGANDFVIIVITIVDGVTLSIGGFADVEDRDVVGITVDDDIRGSGVFADADVFDMADVPPLFDAVIL